VVGAALEVGASVLASAVALALVLAAVSVTAVWGSPQWRAATLSRGRTWTRRIGPG
jgi:hypothetical protein